jgi:hypothetical protein
MIAVHGSGLDEFRSVEIAVWPRKITYLSGRNGVRALMELATLLGLLSGEHTAYHWPAAPFASDDTPIDPIS